jgi:hypothetical protein
MSGIDNDVNHFHVAVEGNPEKEREIAAGRSESAWLHITLLGTVDRE